MKIIIIADRKQQHVSAKGLQKFLTNKFLHIPSKLVESWVPLSLQFQKLFLT